MKATTLLKKQHREVKALFAALKKQSGKTAEKTAQEIVKSLLCHMIIEEEIFYPAVKALDEDLVLEAYEEHATARFTMGRILETPAADDSFEARVTTLKELIEHHVEEEEGDLFPRVERKMGDDALDALGDLIKTEFEQQMRHKIAALFQTVDAFSPQPSRAA